MMVAMVVDLEADQEVVLDPEEMVILLLWNTDINFQIKILE